VISSDAAVDPGLAAALAAGAAGYAETYHPGAPAPATARRVAVQAGDEVNGIDIVLIPAPFRPPTVHIHRK